MARTKQAKRKRDETGSAPFRDEAIDLKEQPADAQGAAENDFATSHLLGLAWTTVRAVLGQLVTIASAGTMAISKRLKTKHEAGGEEWKWLLWESGIARESIHPELGAAWTAVLKEACCVRKDVDKDKVNRLRKHSNERLHLSFDNVIAVEVPPTVSLLKWLVARKCPLYASDFEAAALGGDMDAVKWLREHKCPWDGCKWDEATQKSEPYNACYGATEGGHMRILKWLRKEGCPWDEGTCAHAARGVLGRVEVAAQAGMSVGLADMLGCSH